ncbi:MAG: hypothetical protein KDH96_12630, partial [Candidatus Riesia sp.]|nr:hypothetical protein [Candidatus Riesia sp.]
ENGIKYKIYNNKITKNGITKIYKTKRRISDKPIGRPKTYRNDLRNKLLLLSEEQCKEIIEHYNL